MCLGNKRFNRFAPGTTYIHRPKRILTRSLRCVLPAARAGRTDLFVLAAAIYAMGTAIIGASPAAYAADVMPADAAGLGLGIYRCAGDLGTHTLQSRSLSDPCNGHGWGKGQG